MILDGSGEAGLSDSGADKLIIENFFVSDANRQYKVICDGSVFGITDFEVHAGHCMELPEVIICWDLMADV